MDSIALRNARVEQLVTELVAENSVSSKSNASVNAIVCRWLQALGFETEVLEYKDTQGVPKSNLVAKRNPESTEPVDKGGVGYMAHTDVVPAVDWDTGFNQPFEAYAMQGKLYGRGTCDMKGSLCCAIQAASRIQRKDQKKPIYFVVTADEEIGMQGAKFVVKNSNIWREMIQRDVVGIIGEPTELKVVHAHKGGEGIILRSEGQSAHTSTGGGKNANYQLIPALTEILELRNQTEQLVDYRNSDFDPPTVSMNLVIQNEPLAVNVTTAIAEVCIYFRTMPGVDTSRITNRLRSIQEKHQLLWIDKGGTPCWGVDPQSPWVKEMLQLLGEETSQTVGYGTDAAILQDLPKLMVCGPGSIEQAHRKDEWVSIEQLEKAVNVYELAFRKWAC